MAPTIPARTRYDGDVLFENLEMARTLLAAGGREIVAGSLFVPRRPPSAGHFLGQRVRQAHDDFAQPVRLITESTLLPLALLALIQRRKAGLASRAGVAVLSAFLGSVAMGEVGRRRERGPFRVSVNGSALYSLLVGGTAACVWLAIGHRLAGGTPYRGQRILVAADSNRELRRPH